MADPELNPVTANNDMGTTNEDSILSVSAPGVLTNDSSTNMGALLSVTDINGHSPGTTFDLASGAPLPVVSTGDYSYDPTGAAALNGLAVGESATDTFNYTIGDGHGGSSTAQVTVTVNGVNDDPTAVADTATTDEDTATDINVAANDTDPDLSDLLTVGTFDATSA